MTAETGVPALMLAGGALVAEVASQGSALGAVAFKWADGNLRGARASLAAFVVGQALPSALFRIAAPVDRRFGKFVANSEAEVASNSVEYATCLKQ
jgi:hypothetical protein